ncbi:hypothetical protein FB451DRAFT_1560635 [Mycena latifolia]|nr:hypothetical protein FB451DRAFT_1560635 [Mycena latifolia]
MHLTSFICSAVLLALAVPPASCITLPDTANDANRTVTPAVESNSRFLTSCDSMIFDGRYLQGRCLNLINNYVNASIDLDNCITNNNGNLACAPFPGAGGYRASCAECHATIRISSAILECQCYQSGKVTLQNTKYDLNQCIGNYNGLLNC